MLKKIDIEVTKRIEGAVIKDLLKSFSVGRGKIEELRANKRVVVNGEVVDLSYKLKLGETLTFYSEEKEVKNVNKEIKVLYEDDNFIAVYKEKGLLVHSDGINDDALIFRVASYLEDSIVYPINRIDVETSGIVLFAKHFLSSCALNQLVEAHCVTKQYLLTVKGKLKEKEGEFNFRLGRDRHNAKKMIVNPKGKYYSYTEYEVLKEENENSFVLAEIITGRKHQIRVSFAHVGHPIIGDRLYGDPNDKNELHLEASRIFFFDPFANKAIDIKTENYLKALELKNN